MESFSKYDADWDIAYQSLSAQAAQPKQWEYVRLPTSNVIRTKDQTPQAIKFWEPPTTISPKEANCWTACRRFVKRGPKHRFVFRLAQQSISAVRSITSHTPGGLVRVWDLEVLKVAFWSSERLASNSETACAKRASASPNLRRHSTWLQTGCHKWRSREYMSSLPLPQKWRIYSMILCRPGLR